MINVGRGKRIITIALILFGVVVFLLSTLAVAQIIKQNTSSTEPQSSYAFTVLQDDETGWGYKDNVAISNAEDFAEFMTSISNDNYYITNDIDMSGYEFYPRGTMAFGTKYGGCSEFKGVPAGEFYNGHIWGTGMGESGYTIKNLTIKFDFDGHSNNIGEYPYNNFIGVFGALGPKSLVKGIKFENLTIKITCPINQDMDTITVGGLAGYTRSARIENVAIDGLNIIIEQEHRYIRVGGLIGEAIGIGDYEPTKITYCYVSLNDCTIKGKSIEDYDNYTYYGLIGFDGREIYISSQGTYNLAKTSFEEGIEIAPNKDLTLLYVSSYSSREKGRAGLLNDYWYIPPTDEFNDGWPYLKGTSLKDPPWQGFMYIDTYKFYTEEIIDNEDKETAKHIEIEVPYFQYIYEDTDWLYPETITLFEYNGKATTMIYGTEIVPEKEGYVFSHWSGSAALCEYVPIFIESTKVHTVTFEFPARYTYDVSLDNEYNDKAIYAKHNSIITITTGSEKIELLVENEGLCVYEGLYKFNNKKLKISTYEINGVSYTATLEKTILIEEDVTIKPVFEMVKYFITYHLGGGTNHIDNPEYYYYNDVYGITLYKPTREGYKFLGWSATENGAILSAPQIPVFDYGDKDFYANWEAILYAIEYDLSGGELPEGVINPTTYSKETDTFRLHNPTMKYHTFIGWTGTGLEKTTKEVVIQKGSMGNRSYTAVFEITKLDVVFAFDGVEDVQMTVKENGSLIYLGSSESKVSSVLLEQEAFFTVDKSNNEYLIEIQDCDGNNYTINYLLKDKYEFVNYVIITSNSESVVYGGSVKILDNCKIVANFKLKNYDIEYN